MQPTGKQVLSRINDYFHAEPNRVTVLGQWITFAGIVLLVSAAWGWYATDSAEAIISTLAGRAPVNKTLADVYPTLSFWWVPESGWGLFAALMLIVIGILANAYGRWVDRVHNMT